MSPLIIYHGGGCLDGFGSALAAYCHFQTKQSADAEYKAALHGEPWPDINGRDVYMLDFCYRRDQLREICRQARSVLVIDHHISACKDTEGLDREIDNLKLLFDMDRSGAVMAWEYFHDSAVPQLLLHIQDRDLWRWQDAGSSDITAALASYPQDFERWLVWLEERTSLQQLRQEGVTINRYRHQEIASYRQLAALGTIAGYQVPVVNCPASIVSELLGELAQGYAFAAGYTDLAEKRSWSLRSSPDGIDVSLVATKLGGGGHAKAAGFTTSLASSIRNIPV